MFSYSAENLKSVWGKIKKKRQLKKDINEIKNSNNTKKKSPLKTKKT